MLLLYLNYYSFFYEYSSNKNFHFLLEIEKKEILLKISSITKPAFISRACTSVLTA